MDPDEILKDINAQLDDLRDNLNNLEESLNRQDIENASIKNQPYDIEGCAPWSSVSDPHLFQDLMSSVDFDDEAISTSGSGPWEEDNFDDLLRSFGYDINNIEEGVEVIVVGYDCDKLKEIRERISNSSRGVRIYPQELFLSYLFTGVDPLPLLDKEQSKKWINFHPVLRALFLNGEDFTWNAPADEDELEEDQDLLNEESPLPPPQGVTESPLSLLGYKTGRGSNLSVKERREVLREAFNEELPEISDDQEIDTEQYMAQWGSPKTPRRLWRLARHLSGQYHAKKNNPSQRYAVADWRSDLHWMRDHLYDEAHHTFSWPRMV